MADVDKDPELPAAPDDLGEAAVPDIDGVAADLQQLIRQTQPSLWQRLLNMV